jgi:putative FmdB family regulatory protein
VCSRSDRFMMDVTSMRRITRAGDSLAGDKCGSNPLRGQIGMLLYEYECKACGVRFERRQAITDDPLKACPGCGGELCRLVHPVDSIFRGKGFYVTDNSKVARSSAAPRSKEESKVRMTRRATGKA